MTAQEKQAMIDEGYAPDSVEELSDLLEECEAMIDVMDRENR
jgi:hypothetical protein